MKTITRDQFNNGACLCFECEDVRTCEYRSRYATKCGHFKQWKQPKAENQTKGKQQPKGER